MQAEPPKNYAIKVLLSLLALVVTAVMSAQIIMQPTLVTYRGGTGEIANVYWLGLDGNAHLTHTDESFVRLDEATANLHICHSFSERENCQVYPVLDTAGSIAAVLHLVRRD